MDGADFTRKRRDQAPALVRARDRGRQFLRPPGAGVPRYIAKAGAHARASIASRPDAARVAPAPRPAMRPATPADVWRRRFAPATTPGSAIPTAPGEARS